MTTRAEILAAIGQVAHEVLQHEGPIEPHLRLVEDLELDSLQLFTLAVEVENRFRVRLDPPDEERIRTVGDLATIVAEKLGGVASPSRP
jgi:acyl carrier protein